jgi:hypothetical protein
MLLSVVETLERTFSFHICRALEVSVERVVPTGICVLTLLQAWATEMNETPTLEVTVVCLKLKTAPKRFVETTLEESL